MEYIIVAFRNRTQTILLYQVLSESGVNCEIVNTPKEAGVGCGLSVKIPKFATAKVKMLLQTGKFNTFAGFFLVKMLAGNKIVRSI